jgi:hypothetical protein
LFDEQDKIALQHILSHKQRWGVIKKAYSIDRVFFLGQCNCHVILASLQTLERDEVTKVKVTLESGWKIRGHERHNWNTAIA